MQKSSRQTAQTKLSRNGNGTKPAKMRSSLEDNVQRLSMDGSLARAARSAIRAQRAAGLAITYKRGNLVIKKYPSGREEVLDTIQPGRRYKPPRGVSIIKPR